MKINLGLVLAAILMLLSPPVDARVSAGIPSLDEMAGDWQLMQNIANPPDVNNFHDMLLVNRDLTSFFCNPEDWLWSDGKFRFGYPPVMLTIAGKEYPATECRWYPYCALRRNLNCNGFEVETDTRMINEQRAVLVRIKIFNPSETKRSVEFALSVAGKLQSDKISVLNTNQRPGFATVICTATVSDFTTNSNDTVHWRWNAVIPAHGTRIIEFVAGDGHTEDTAKIQHDVIRWSKSFSQEFSGFKQCWQQRWADAFTPGNHHFSGNLPVLITKDTALRRNYYMGVLTMLELERTQFPVSARSFITSGERAPGTQFYWDASMQSTAWALLEPVGMKAVLRRWLVQNPRSGQVIFLTEIRGFDAKVYDKITGYAFNACTIFKTALDYIRVTGDIAFLDEKLEDGKTVLQRMDEMATDWKTLVHPGSALADYGENQNLLECAPAYIGHVPSCNAQNIWMMRQDAALQELKGNTARAHKLRDDAEELLSAVLSLYKSGDGVWYGLHDDGKRVELRHCVDYIYVGNAIANDLSFDKRREMTDFIKRELLTRDWMRAMSLKDAAAAVSDRPDHGPMGAYDGWPALTVGTMWRLGFPKDAFKFYCSTAEVTKEGPFAQAREFYGERRKEYEAPVRIAEREGCMKECISGGAFADVVLNTFFGFEPSLDGKNMLADAQTPRPFTGQLMNVLFHGKKITIGAGASGVHYAKE